ncbi:Mitochondrial small ribosomal subunit Rsm22 [Gracilaria domingensis]|nr:Mitochondrial small ribosomal subunit Rsm22 [Gracilaria domingensis]
MLKLAEKLLSVDPTVASTDVKYAASPKDHILKGETYDIVCASYSLNEIVRSAIANPHDSTHSDNQDTQSGPVCRENRVKLAEKLLRRVIKSLWARTTLGGLLIIVEDGTAAGFETVSFARDVVLNLNADQKAVENDSEMLSEGENAHHTTAKVIAPCLHSKACPLKDSITRHRVCRFQQRLNRPLFSRNADPLPTGYEDEYFSFIAIQKITLNSNSTTEDEASGWGRMIRAPLLRAKHIALDVCTSDGNLERRVVSKKSALPGQFSKARRSRWGDIWLEEPSSKPQPLNF